MNADELEAGRELDVLVAEKVMGLIPCDKWRATYGGYGMAITMQGALHVNDGCEHDGRCYPIGHPSCYSTNIAAAWEVVEKLNKMQLGWFSLEQFGARGQEEWTAMIWTGGEDEADCFAGHAETVPPAICHAALKAIQNER